MPLGEGLTTPQEVLVNTEDPILLFSSDVLVSACCSVPVSEITVPWEAIQFLTRSSYYCFTLLLW